VVLYEDVAKKRVKRLVGAVRDMAALRKALAALEKVGRPAGRLGAGGS
jgi:hypothetical protein